MPTSDYPVASQLHADRTARIVREHRSLRMPTVRSPFRFSRKQRAAAARLATSC
jgi:hypothetical protein